MHDYNCFCMHFYLYSYLQLKYQYVKIDLILPFLLYSVSFANLSEAGQSIILSVVASEEAD